MEELAVRIWDKFYTEDIWFLPGGLLDRCGLRLKLKELPGAEKWRLLISQQLQTVSRQIDLTCNNTTTAVTWIDYDNK